MCVKATSTMCSPAAADIDPSVQLLIAAQSAQPPAAEPMSGVRGLRCSSKRAVSGKLKYLTRLGCAN